MGTHEENQHSMELSATHRESNKPGAARVPGSPSTEMAAAGRSEDKFCPFCPLIVLVCLLLLL